MLLSGTSPGLSLRVKRCQPGCTGLIGRQRALSSPYSSPLVPLLRAAEQQRQGKARWSISALPGNAREAHLVQKHLPRTIFTLEDVLADIGAQGEGIEIHSKKRNTTTLQAAANLLYRLAKQLSKASDRVKSANRAHIASAYSACEEVILQAIREDREVASGETSAMLSLRAKDVSLTAFAAAQLSKASGVNVLPLCSGIIDHMLRSDSFLREFQWIDWAQLLLGFSNIGMRPESEKKRGTPALLQQLFDKALPILIPQLVQHDPERRDQAISNIFYAGAKAGAIGNWEEYMMGIVEGHRAGVCMQQAIAQDCANMVWAVAKLERYDPEFLALMTELMLEQTGKATAQALSNTLWGLSTVGWYRPHVYERLLQSCLEIRLNGQDISNLLIACSLVKHRSPSLLTFIDMVYQRVDLADWSPQQVANSLYSCAALAGEPQAAAKANDGHSALATSLNRLSALLFKQAAQMNLNDIVDLRQLHRAHAVAQLYGQPGIPSGSPLLLKAKKGFLKNLSDMYRTPGLGPLLSAVGKVKGYKQIPPFVHEERIFIPGALQDLLHPFRYSFYVCSRSQYLKHPLGQLTGPAQVQFDDNRSLFDCAIIVYAHEWEALGGDIDKQRAFVSRLLDEARQAARAVREQQQQGEELASSTGQSPSLPQYRTLSPMVGLISPPAPFLFATQQPAINNQSSFSPELPSASKAVVHGSEMASVDEFTPGPSLPSPSSSLAFSPSHLSSLLLPPSPLVPTPPPSLTPLLSVEESKAKAAAAAEQLKAMLPSSKPSTKRPSSLKMMTKPMRR